MDNSEFSKIYWGKLKVLVGDMISNSVLFDDKAKYVVECWDKLESEIDKIDISEKDKRATFIKLRKQIEDEILKS
ncbi:hypothetical protein PYS58_07785 [Chryseobacterium indologenes]|uniref:hypothetical protein n=1 Tax=Chryseobacterium indologenes TaxID=253 RepID=UPI0023E84B18|nr:hypothetical protein [Chryseobacterium indologenes]WET51029.1 hypothetical protein PYS58_07785 [Chryseobacterium indologenes]